MFVLDVFFQIVLSSESLGTEWTLHTMLGGPTSLHVSVIISGMLDQDSTLGTLLHGSSRILRCEQRRELK